MCLQIVQQELSGLIQITLIVACLQIVQQELSRLIKINREQNRSQKELYQKMMGTDKEPFIKQQTPFKVCVLQKVSTCQFFLNRRIIIYSNCIFMFLYQYVCDTFSIPALYTLFIMRHFTTRGHLLCLCSFTIV